MIQAAKRGLAQRHVKSFIEAMLRLGFRQEEIVALLKQEIEEGTRDVSTGM